MAVDVLDPHAERADIRSSAQLAAHDRFASQRMAPASVLKFLLAVNVIAVKVPSVSWKTPRNTDSLLPRLKVFISVSPG